MAAAGAISIWISTSSPTKITASNTKPRISYPLKLSRNGIYPLSTFEKNGQHEQNFTIKAAASSSDGMEERFDLGTNAVELLLEVQNTQKNQLTKVKFQRSLSLPGCFYFIDTGKRFLQLLVSRSMLQASMSMTPSLVD
ncbi:hypothetical protein H5410_038745 [Solanum commersonii]|uniref:Uncharacterized protein n=1 Tax=Solanum commersonii TaxID=4109 RepID=A0A9J5YB07_SOLCO|nr:hypothetical protein H5410_038745 [Solanum commersonii]